LDNPGARIFRDAVSPPLIHGGDKSFLSRLFGKLEVSEVANKSGNDPAPIRVVHCVYSGVGVWKHVR
jgi:hypothetical protein